MTPLRWFLLIAAFVAVRSSHADSRSALQVNPLAIIHDGASYTRPAVPGETHWYEASLVAGDFLEISVSQDQLVVGVSVHGSEDAVIHRGGFPGIDPLPQRLMFVAPVSGSYRVEVYIDRGFPRASELRKRGEARADSDLRQYTFQVVALRPATANDRVRASWFDVVERASALARLERIDALQQAIEVFHEASAGWRAVGDVVLEISTVESLATVTGLFTQFHRESASARERLTELYPQTEDPEQEIQNWRRLATKYSQGGRFVNARQAAGRAMELALNLGLRATAAGSQRELGLYEYELGNYERARELAQEAQTLAAGIPDPAVEALAMSDLARLDDLAGDLDAAIARNRRALSLAAGNRPATALITMWLGFNHLRRGEFDDAASRLNARLAMSPTNVQRDQEALTRVGLGDVSLARGDRDTARHIYEAAASALERGAQLFRCFAEQRVGRMDLEDGLLDHARARFERLLEIAATQYFPLCEAEGRAGLSDVAAQTGDLIAADAEARRVVELAEAFREAAVSSESRSLGFGALAPAYERAIDISMRRAERGDAESMARALTLNEQALARGLLDRIAENRLDARAHVPTALATEYRQLRERWRARLAELQVAMRTRPEATESKVLEHETSLLAVQVRDLEARIDATDTRHASFVRPRPLGVPAIQALLEDDTVILEYALGEARSYLWVVSPRDIRAFTLAPRAEIEALARRVHESFGRTPAPKKVSDSWRVDEVDRRALTRLVLAPAAALLGERRLVVVPAGALSLVPFAALPAPRSTVDPQPMIARHEVVQIPSATILAAMRTLTATRARPRRTVAIFADPIFDAGDPRVRSVSSPTSSPTLSLPRLPFSREEAAAIASLVPDRATTFLGAEATRERVLGRALADYRFVHFATHSVVNQEVPGLSSIALSMVDRAGRPHDGLVMLPDVYEMTLNADVAVLSGCQTALGKQVRGEGAIGLARGFMYAGVPRVVASLWQVSDLGTAELMKRFYRGMLVEKLTPAAALRRAQRELAANPRWASPYFWAPFILQGDWH